MDEVSHTRDAAARLRLAEDELTRLQTNIVTLQAELESTNMEKEMVRVILCC